MVLLMFTVVASITNAALSDQITSFFGSGSSESTGIAWYDSNPGFFNFIILFFLFFIVIYLGLSNAGSKWKESGLGRSVVALSVVLALITTISAIKFGMTAAFLAQYFGTVLFILLTIFLYYILTRAMFFGDKHKFVAFLCALLLAFVITRAAIAAVPPTSGYGSGSYGSSYPSGSGFFGRMFDFNNGFFGFGRGASGISGFGYDSTGGSNWGTSGGGYPDSGGGSSSGGGVPPGPVPSYGGGGTPPVPVPPGGGGWSLPSFKTTAQTNCTKGVNSPPKDIPSLQNIVMFCKAELAAKRGTPEEPVFKNYYSRAVRNFALAQAEQHKTNGDCTNAVATLDALIFADPDVTAADKDDIRDNLYAESCECKYSRELTSIEKKLDLAKQLLKADPIQARTNYGDAVRERDALNAAIRTGGCRNLNI